MVQRGGDVITCIVPNVRTFTLLPKLVERVLPASIIYTDELNSYNALGRTGYDHRRVHHQAKVYVIGDAHTNTIEGFWSLTKNGIRGVFHSVSAKHLQSYLSEYAWRYNRRNSGEAKFQSLLLCAATASLPAA